MSTRPPGSPDIDLTFDNSFGVLNGAVFMTGPTQSAGTGTFNSFVQLQHTGIEQGYNTDASAQFDEKSTLNHNHSVLLANVPIVVGDGTNGTIDGITYREFLLDLNESTGTAAYISLDALQIWQEEAGNLTNFTAGFGFADLPARTPIISPTISMPAAIIGSRSTTGSRTAAARAMSAS
jgi:hypothetical protein